MKINHLFFLLPIFWLASCNTNNDARLNIKSSELPQVNVTLKDYGSTLFGLDTTHFLQELQAIQNDFPQFLNGNLEDTANYNKLFAFVSDTHLIAIYNKTKAKFANREFLRQDLSASFSRLAYFFPGFTIPEVFTYVSGIQFDAPVLVTESSVVIALDCYLGTDEILYQRMGIPLYQRRRMTANHVVKDVNSALYSVYFESNRQSANILDEMIHAGKKYYFMELMQPNIDPAVLFGYSSEQLQWIETNEGTVWGTLVGEQLLYKGEPLLFRKLFGDGPFSQDFSQDAPPRIGEYIGWKIVRGLMQQQPELSMADLLNMTDAQNILQQSRYKPRR